WLERHAGIVGRRIWGKQDPLAAATTAGRECLERSRIRPADVGALLVTSEAPPLLAGLAAALHHRLELPPTAVALEIGGACTGYLASLWLAQSLIARAGVALVLAVEAATKYLRVEPGDAGEGAALFGDGAAASVLTPGPTNSGSIPISEVIF